MEEVWVCARDEPGMEGCVVLFLCIVVPYESASGHKDAREIVFDECVDVGPKQDLFTRKTIYWIYKNGQKNECLSPPLISTVTFS